MAVMRPPGPSLARAQRTTARDGIRARSADDAAGGKKKISASAAWREARDLLRVHRSRLFLGLVEISRRRSDRQGAQRAAAADRERRRTRDGRAGRDLLPQLADPRRRRAA